MTNMKALYLDHAATTPTHPEVVKAMMPYFTGEFGNPSSIHSAGQEAKAAVEKARESVAGLIGCQPDEIVFTSGGTESDNMAIRGVAHANGLGGNHIITTMIEHPAVLEPCRFLESQGFRITRLPVDRQGIVDPGDVRKAITDDTILISVMEANNEIGTVQPVYEIGVIAREKGVCFHTDAVQTVGHIPVDMTEVSVDLLSISAHKLYGPKGVGALYIRTGTSIAPFIQGGGQEGGLRASTENVPAIVGFGKAAQIALDEMELEMDHLVLLRERLIGGLLDRIDHIHLNGHPSQRLPNSVNVSVEYVNGDSVVMGLDMEGIAASTGSACHSGGGEPSHVLRALGLSDDLARASLRFTLGRETTREDVDRVLDVLPRVVARLRSMSPLYRST